MTSEGISAVVFALEVENEKDSSHGGEEEDDYHYDPAVMLIYPVQMLAKYISIAQRNIP